MITKSNTIKDNELFNPELKMVFIKSRTLKQQSQTLENMLYNLFRQSAIIEKEVGKDIYEFSVVEYKRLVFSLNRLSLSSVLKDHSIFSSYVSFCISNNFINSKDVFLKSITNDDLKDFRKFNSIF